MVSSNYCMCLCVHLSLECASEDSPFQWLLQLAEPFEILVLVEVLVVEDSSAMLWVVADDKAGLQSYLRLGAT